MAYASRPDSFPGSDLDGFPTAIRQAFHRRGRAVAALRVYDRRGWNTSGVRAECARASIELDRLLSEWESAENNPTLF